jgi:hypothetical protein
MFIDDKLSGYKMFRLFLFVLCLTTAQSSLIQRFEKCLDGYNVDDYVLYTDLFTISKCIMAKPVLVGGRLQSPLSVLKCMHYVYTRNFNHKYLIHILQIKQRFDDVRNCLTNTNEVSTETSLINALVTHAMTYSVRHSRHLHHTSPLPIGNTTSVNIITTPSTPVLLNSTLSSTRVLSTTDRTPPISSTTVTIPTSTTSMTTTVADPFDE